MYRFALPACIFAVPLCDSNTLSLSIQKVLPFKGLRLVFIAELIELFAVVAATVLLGMESQAMQAAAGAVVLITAIVGGILSLKGLIGAGE